MLTRVYIGMALGGLALFLSGCGSRAEPEKATPASKKKLLAGGAKLVTLGMFQVGCNKPDKPGAPATPPGVAPTDVTLLVPGMN